MEITRRPIASLGHAVKGASIRLTTGRPEKKGPGLGARALREVAPLEEEADLQHERT